MAADDQTAAHESNADAAAAAAPPRRRFPIVAIGASAGGLDALRLMLTNIRANTGMGFVVIQHLDRDTESMLARLLAASTAMPVSEVTGAVTVEPDHVYVMPPGSDMTIAEGRLTLLERHQASTPHLPIDEFMRALAADVGECAIGVILSGANSDGTHGLRAIKAAGGLALVQEPSSAQFRTMPESALAAGVADHHAPPEALGSELARLSQHPFFSLAPDALAEDDASLGRILTAIREHSRLDFRGYKRPTLLRRIARRTALLHSPSLADYADKVSADPVEARALGEDVLIHVTSFFRVPATFDAIAASVLPGLIAAKESGRALRVWVAGCSTGEEAYSLAICLIEGLEAQRRTVPIKLFASDLSDHAVESARAGLYTTSALDGVSPARLARFFERAEGGYRVCKAVRDVCVFVRHDLTRDPPFARLDLISCRNVLIYFDTELQRRVITLLHHCLNKPGYLVLGSSEGLRERDELFAPVDKEQKIFLKVGDSPRIEYPPALAADDKPLRLPMFPAAQRPHPGREAQRQADHILLARYAPPGVVVDERMEVVQFRGRSGAFLEAPPGAPQHNLLKLARGGLVNPLREAITDAKARGVTVRAQGVRITERGHARAIDLEVTPLTSPGAEADRYFLVVFEEQRPADANVSPPVTPGARATAEAAADAAAELASLRAELAATKEYLQALTTEHQDMGEELRAANEELIASNEELQSTNEELQSAKEELQSTNEELTTLNDELQLRNQHLDLIAGDLVNVLESVQIPVIIVDKILRIRRFTPSTQTISNLLPGDVGRSIDDLKLKLKLDDLADRIRGTLGTMLAREDEIQANDGRWYRLHIRPYLTPDQRLDGAVLSFVDIDRLKQAIGDAENARDFAQGIVETVPMSLVVVDAALRIVTANPPFQAAFTARVTPSVRPALLEVASAALDVAPLKAALATSLATHVPFRDLELQCTVPATGVRTLVAAGCPIHGADGGLLLLLALEDVTARRHLETSERLARVEAERANQAKDLFLATLSHELRAPLGTILMSAQVLQLASTGDPRVQRASAAIERAVGNQARLIEDLLDISRIVSGKLILDLQPVDLRSVVLDAVDAAQAAADAKGVMLALERVDAMPPLHGDPVRLQQVVTNLLHNAVKFTPPGGRVDVLLMVVADKAELTVHDTGIGLRAGMMEHLFDRFVQAESAMTRTHGGLGLGLAIVRHIVTVHGGEVRAESPGDDQGSTFTVTLPLTSMEVQHLAPVARRVTHSIEGIRVLIIDDDADTREACAAALTTLGADVRTARSAAAGLGAIGQFAAQVILCDLAMPGEDGYAFIGALRRGTTAPTTPAAAVSALASAEDRRRALEAGFQIHLAKPVDAIRLAAAVATLAAPAPLPV